MENLSTLTALLILEWQVQTLVQSMTGWAIDHFINTIGNVRKYMGFIMILTLKTTP